MKSEAEIPSYKLDISVKAILMMATPVSLGYFVQFIVAFTDNYFSARIDGNAMSAAAYVGLLYITLVMIGIGLSNAAQILVARRKGEQRNGDVGAIVGNAFWIAIVTAFVQFALLFFVFPPLMKDWLSSENVQEYMMQFIFYRSFGFFFYTPTLILNAFWSGIAKTRVMMYTTIITSVVNMILAYGLIFGHFGLPEMGIAGGALAATIAEGCAFLFALIYTWYSKSQADYDVNRYMYQLPVKHSWEIIKLGLPISMQMLLALGVWSLFFKFIDDMGEQELQSSFIVRNMYSLMYVSVGGFSTTTKTYISGLIAEGRQKDLIPTIVKMMLLNFVGLLLLSHGLWLYPEAIARLFTTDPAIIQQTADCMWVVLPAMLVFAFTNILLATLEGSGNAFKGFLVEMFTTMMYISVAYVMVYIWKWPIHLVWTADYVYFFFIGILSLAFLWNGKWKVHKI
ncbi:MAG: MATE family efflux transporter [Flavobacteriales bacterium]